MLGAVVCCGVSHVSLAGALTGSGAYFGSFLAAARSPYSEASFRICSTLLVLPLVRKSFTCNQVINSIVHVAILKGGCLG